MVHSSVVSLQATCRSLRCKSLDCLRLQRSQVDWGAEGGLQKLAGTAVVLTISIEEAQLFSFRFGGSSASMAADGI